MPPADYSVVVPVYYNADTLEFTERRIREEVFAKVPGKRGEMVFVDDGSGPPPRRRPRIQALPQLRTVQRHLVRPLPDLRPMHSDGG